MREKRLHIAFESGRLSYSENEVDLYNSGINQILSVAAVRGHHLYHFSIEDVYKQKTEAYARASILSLPDSWHGNYLKSHIMLKKIDERPLPLSQIDLCFFRADDVRHTSTPHLNLLRVVQQKGVLFENLEATLSTCDKCELTRRTDVPQPQTFAAHTFKEAMEAVNQLPDREGCFILKDRYGYGCGEQVHRLEFKDPRLKEVINMYLSTYNFIILQEYCPEVKQGDIVVTFFDGELLAPMLRVAKGQEWKTNYSLGAVQIPYTLSSQQEEIARTVQQAFPECRYFSVDMFPSGKVIEVNAFPGGEGLLDLYGISVGNIIMDQMESELLGRIETGTAQIKAASPPAETRWEPLHKHYKPFIQPVEVIDVFSREKYELSVEELIEFRPQSSDFILSIPHSGVLIPTQYEDYFDLNTQSLTEIDLFSDILFEALGGLQVVSRLSPFFVNMNREREGTQKPEVPRHLKNPPTRYITIKDKPILKKDYTPNQIEEILKYYDLYHNLLETLIGQMKKEKGYALLIDGHSMTSLGLGRAYDKGKERDNFVVGTLGDTSAHTRIISSFVEAIRESARAHGLGLTLAKNEPYTGGFITRKHNDPENHVHVIQIEVSMDTYMYEPGDESVVKRYALKQSRVKITQDILRRGISAASQSAERLHFKT
ncbi:N-formylglutamate amidohydrolase [bacterium]|nr:N-formylglutamate amidohydrolase [bacterium]